MSWKFLEPQKGWRILLFGLLWEFSTTRNLTCNGFPSAIQKILVIKCSCREKAVQLQRMSALRCVLLSPGRLKVVSIGCTEWSVNSSKCLLHAYDLRWRRVLEETFQNCKVCSFWRIRKSSFSPSFELFRVDLVTSKCNVVGQAFVNVDFVVYIGKSIGHVTLSVLALDQNWRWIFKKSCIERIVGSSGSTIVGEYLFIMGRLRNYSDFFGKIVKNVAHDYVELFVNIEKGMCHLDTEVFVSLTDVARHVDFWREELA